jgi:hypothetical protein
VEARAAEGVRLRWFQALATLEVAATLDRLIEVAESKGEKLADRN